MIRRASPADREAIATVQEAAFGGEGPVIVRLIDALTAHPCGRDGMSFVAETGGGVVGHAMVTRSLLDTFEATIDVAVLSPLGVDPGHQREGIGRALVDRCVAEAAAAGLPLIFLEGDPAYYARLGFCGAKPLGFRKPSLRIPDDAFQVIRLPDCQDWMTGTLVYASPFWDLDCVGLRDPAILAWLADEVREGRQD